MLIFDQLKKDDPATAVRRGARAGRPGHAAGRIVVGAGGVGPGLSGEPRNPVLPHGAHSGGARQDSGSERRGAGGEPAHLQRQPVSGRTAQVVRHGLCRGSHPRPSRAETGPARTGNEAESQADQRGAKAVHLHAESEGRAAATGALRGRQQRGAADQPAAAAAALAEPDQLRAPLPNPPRPALPGADGSEPGPNRALRGAVHQPDGSRSGGPIHALLSLRHHGGARPGSSATRR